MTKIILFAICFIPMQFIAQGNLQFNQVIGQSYNTSVASDAYTTMGTISVPSGKVVKIESVGFYANNGNAVEGVILIGGHVAYSKSIHNSSAMFEIHHCPIWLREGTYAFQVRHEWGSNINVRSSFSGIEFNIVP